MGRHRARSGDVPTALRWAVAGIVLGAVEEIFTGLLGGSDDLPPLFFAPVLVLVGLSTMGATWRAYGVAFAVGVAVFVAIEAALGIPEGRLLPSVAMGAAMVAGAVAGALATGRED